MILKIISLLKGHKKDMRIAYDVYNYSWICETYVDHTNLMVIYFYLTKKKDKNM